MHRWTLIAGLLLTSACGTAELLETPDADVGDDVSVSDAGPDASDTPTDVAACTGSDSSGCPAPTEPACARAVCSDGVCGIEPVSPGTTLPESRQKPGDCRRLVCDGKGGVREDPADDPPPEEPCTGYLCVAGELKPTPKAKGVKCATGVCVEGACVPATCVDLVRDGDESDVDCGGSCAPCSEGKACGAAKDCASGSCKAGLCAAPTCDDGVKNGLETDVDCGGGCKACPDGKACLKGADCTSLSCTGGLCVAASCGDGVQNGSETDIDCGGSCAPCKTGAKCGSTKDCVSLVCASGVCAAPTCSDGVRNGDESDVDCGGATCAGCALGGLCKASTDCTTKWCSAGKCATPTCTDGARNGSETDVDCGGGCPSTCALAKGCATDADCASGSCYFGHCARPFFRLDGARAFQAGTGPYAVLADFDGDGDLDVVKADGGFSTFWLSLLRNDKGVLGAPTSIALTAPLANVATGDFDGDGRPDLVGVARASTYAYLDEVHVLLNAGGGTFKAPVVYKVPAIRLVVGDFNADGRSDLVVVSKLGDGAVFLADPSGTLVKKQALASSGSLIVTTGDVDADGDLDVILAHESGTSTVFANAGDGSFSAVGTVDTNLAVDGMSMELADFDEDGLPDLLFFNTVVFELHRNFGAGRFVWVAGISVAPDTVNGWTIADVNRDGHLDIAYSSYELDQILLGDGKGGFPTKRTLPRGSSACFLRFVPMDGDCRPDLLRVDFYGRIDLTYGGDDSFMTVRRVAPYTYDFALADADGDGRTDVFGIWGEWLDLSLNDGLWSPVEGKSKMIKVGPTTTAVTTADLDGDKRPEAIVVDRAALLLNVVSFKDGSWDAAAMKTYKTTRRPLSVVAADFDRDGRVDIFVLGAESSGSGPTSEVFWNKPTGLVPETMGYGGSRVAAADLDGDGWTDLVCVGAGDSGEEDRLYVVWNNAGKLDLSAYLPVTGGTVALGDIDGDGLVDVAYTGGGVVGVLRNLGARTFAKTPSTYKTQIFPYGIVLGDLDGDGRPELVVRNAISESVSVLRNRGGGILAPEESWKASYTNGLTSTQWSATLQLADMDGDGQLDVVTNSTTLVLKNLAGTPPKPCGTCGDGKKTFPEVCDDGNAKAGDGCTACTLDLGWSCAGTTCSPICGDRLMKGTETCDDGNATGADGCSASCAIETGWTCSAAKPGVVSKCLATCGDSMVVGYELCDDGNVLDGDTCPSTCRRDLWVRRFGDARKQVGTTIASDATGSWVAGTFTGKLDFGPAGVLTAGASGLPDAFLLRVSDTGVAVLARKLSGSIDPRKVVGDGAGNVYLVGSFNGLAALGGGSTGFSGKSAFVAKYDSTGGHLWSKSFGATGVDPVAFTAIASPSGVTFGGHFANALALGCSTLTAAGGQDAFVTTLDATGACVRSVSFGGTGYDEVTALAQGGGALYVGGTFESSLPLGSTTLVAKGAPDLFLLRLDGSTFTWAKRLGQNNVYEQLASLAWDGSGLWVGGSFNTDIDFGSGPLTTAGASDVFVARVDASGTPTLAKRFGDAANQTLSGLAIDSGGQAVITGLLEGTVDFGGVSLGAKGVDDTYVVKLAADGKVVWGTSFVAGRGGAVSCTPGSRRVNLTTYANGPLTFGPTTYPPVGDSDLLLVSLAP